MELDDSFDSCITTTLTLFLSITTHSSQFCQPVCNSISVELHNVDAAPVVLLEVATDVQLEFVHAIPLEDAPSGKAAHNVILEDVLPVPLEAAPKSLIC